ncbi:MAG: hypothetical protein R3B13_08230 [Polyangiaceae bacterium]
MSQPTASILPALLPRRPSLGFAAALAALCSLGVAGCEGDEASGSKPGNFSGDAGGSGGSAASDASTNLDAGSDADAFTQGDAPAGDAAPGDAGPIPKDMVFYSSFATTTGTGSVPNEDNGKWDRYTEGAAGGVMEVISANGLDFPAGMTNVRRLNILGIYGNSQMLDGNGVIPDMTGDGDTLFYRWYYRVAAPEPWPSTDRKNHNIENGNVQNWTFQSWLNDDGTWDMKLAWSNSANPSAYLFEIPPLDKNQTYRFEMKIERVSAATFNAEARVYDSSDKLLYDTTDFVNRFGSGNIANSGPFNFENVDLMDTFQAGCNGFSGNVAPVNGQVYAYDGGYAICTKDWCGPWSSAEEP